MSTNLVVAIFSSRTFLQIHAFQYGILAVFPLDGKHGLLHFTLASCWFFSLIGWGPSGEGGLLLHGLYQ
nr:hypothetical protein [uncultured Dysosmobacter sp.]